MNATDEKPPGVVGVATSGIQDVSALLPLLGTEQCERLVTSAMKNGLLYAAATPMSIFGSLGIAKAGFVVLWASIDSQWFPGPSLLRDAGFTPSGIGELLAYVPQDGRRLNVAEDKVRRLFAGKRIYRVTINPSSKDLIRWNLLLVGTTVCLSMFGLIPYIFLIIRFLPDRPFKDTWLYPILRIVGCDIVSIAIQFIFQLRILEETYCRIRFMATDAFLKDHGKTLPNFWDPNERSHRILKELREHCSRKNEKASPTPGLRLSRVSQPPDPNYIDDHTKQSVGEGLGTLSSFSFPQYCPPSSASPHAIPSSPSVPPPPTARDRPSSPNGAEKAQADAQSSHPSATYSFTAATLCACQVALLFGLILVVVGYIGCFSVVQASPRPDSRGALVWLVCEASLAMIRTSLWAANPKWDDAKSPIALERVVDAGSPIAPAKIADTTPPRAPEKVEATDGGPSYGIGWMLNSVTVDDMHALIVGINEFRHPTLKDLDGCVPDAQQVAKYLEDTLLVPRKQIVTLTNSEATKKRIIEELQALSQNASVTQDAPIVVYFATHSFMGDDKRAYLVPHLVPEELEDGSVSKVADPADLYISYGTIVDLLRQIAEKTDNIILILDTCYAGAMGRNKDFDNSSNLRPPQFPQPEPRHRTRALEGSPPRAGENQIDEDLPRPQLEDRAIARAFRIKAPLSTAPEVFVGHSSHILIAGTGADDYAKESKDKGGVFTRALLEVLGKHDALGTMKYQDLIAEINRRMEGQKAICTTIYQNRLLFNGLFSRRVPEGGIKPVITVQYSNL